MRGRIARGFGGGAGAGAAAVFVTATGSSLGIRLRWSSVEKLGRFHFATRAAMDWISFSVPARLASSARFRRVSKIFEMWRLRSRYLVSISFFQEAAACRERSFSIRSRAFGP